MVTSRGKFIVLEGADCSGKTIHTGMLADSLQADGIRVTTVRDPGTTKVSEALRGILKGPDYVLDPMTEALLFYAARRSEYLSVIKPALDDGVTVISDRFDLSTYVYQGEVGGITPEEITAIKYLALGDFSPDFTILLQAPESRYLLGKTNDRFENRGLDFYRKVVKAYRSVFSDRVTSGCTIESTAGIKDTAAIIRKCVNEHMGL